MVCLCLFPNMVLVSISGPFNLVKEMYLVVNKSFNMRLWNVAFHKTRASCSYFGKFIRPLIAPKTYMCSNPLNMDCVVFAN